MMLKIFNKTTKTSSPPYTNNQPHHNTIRPTQKIFIRNRNEARNHLYYYAYGYHISRTGIFQSRIRRHYARAQSHFQRFEIEDQQVRRRCRAFVDQPCRYERFRPSFFRREKSFRNFADQENTKSKKFSSKVSRASR